MSWSTAALSAFDGEIPGVADDPPPGWTELVDGRGVFLRRTDPQPDAPDGAGPDAWYVHGLAGSSSNWTSLAGALSRRATGYLVDLPGHGRSDPPPRGRYSLVADADLLAVLIRRRSTGPVHLVGNSLGGIVCTALAARHPELVHTLTLISPAVPDFRLTRDRGADPILALLLVPGTAGLAVRRLASISPMARARGMAELCFGDPARLTDSDYAVAAAESGLAFPAAVGASVHHRIAAGTVAELSAADRIVRCRCGGVTARTLVIWGTRDRLVDVRLARRAAAAVRKLFAAGHSRCGHTAQMEDPLATARAVGGLWENPGAPHPGHTATVATSLP